PAPRPPHSFPTRRSSDLSALGRTALPLLAAVLVAGRAVAQQTDPRLERLDATIRPIVAALVDSARAAALPVEPLVQRALEGATKDRKSTRLNSSHQIISY